MLRVAPRLHPSHRRELGGHICYWTNEYGGAEAMATDTHFTVSDPACGPIETAGIIEWVAMSANGDTHQGIGPGAVLERACHPAAAGSRHATRF